MNIRTIEQRYVIDEHVSGSTVPPLAQVMATITPRPYGIEIALTSLDCKTGKVQTNQYVMGLEGVCGEHLRVALEGLRQAAIRAVPKFRDEEPSDD